MEKEIWKDIPEYEGLYQVSNYGRIASLLFQNNVWNKKYKRFKILKPKIQNRKDGRKDKRVILYKEKKSKTFLVSRIIAFTFYNENLNNHDLTVNHIDGNSLNNNLNNLELISLNENIQHALKMGLYDKNRKKIKLTDKSTNKNYEFKSMADASRFMKKHNGYISDKLGKNKKENKIYKWEIIK